MVVGSRGGLVVLVEGARDVFGVLMSDIVSSVGAHCKLDGVTCVGVLAHVGCRFGGDKLAANSNSTNPTDPK